MLLTTFQTADDFLQVVEPTLAANEAANNLMYGMALRARHFPERFKTPPYFAAVQQQGQLLAAALLTPPYPLQVFSVADPAAAFELLAQDLRQHHWPVSGVLGPSPAALAFAEIWQRRYGQAYRLEDHERVYELRQVIWPPQPAGAMRPATSADLELLAGWLFSFWREAIPQEPHTPTEALEAAQIKIIDHDYYVWDTGQVVALAGRSRPTPHGYCIGPVYTPPQYRGQGYASALTAALSQLLLDGGKKFTMLFTNLANPTSNSIYQKIGYRPICDFDKYRFETAA